MKKIIAFLIIIALIVVCITFVRYSELKRIKQKVDGINSEFLVYEGRKIQINTLNTLMNKAIQYNYDNNVAQDEKNVFLENEENSIKIYIELSLEQTTVTMERLLLNKDPSNRPEKVELAFGDTLFMMSDVQYHQKTGQIKSITFKEIIE